MSKLAPIVLFSYNRPWHTHQTVEALQKNEMAAESELFIYSDAPKNEESEPAVQEVREYIHHINGFKRVKIVERQHNWGLADSIIDGVTTIINEYGRVIVLEDDLITSPYFLRFMNDALEYYKDEKKVWHVSGWNYPIDTEGLEDVFFWRVMNCWGWATWADRWKYYEKDVNKLINTFSRKDIRQFNLDGVHNFWRQVTLNKKGVINTWAIFWYATIFINDGLCLGPSVSLVNNIGHDGSGMHCGMSDSYYNRKLCTKKDINLSTNIIENKTAVNRIKKYYKNQKKFLLIRALKKINRIIANK